MSHGLALLTERCVTGDAYKYIAMLSKVCDFDIERDPRRHAVAVRRQRPDFCIVRGDHHSTYEVPLRFGIPYILLQGDVPGMLVGPSPREREMVEGAAAIVFNCEATLEWCSEHYGLPDDVEVIYLRPLREQLDFDPMPKLKGKHLVYAGGLQSRGMLGTNSGYRVYHDIFHEFIVKGWYVHLYYPWLRRQSMAEYLRLGCKMHGYVAEKDLPQELSQYTAGFQGYNLEGTTEAGLAYCDIAKPNKAWLYLAAGIPTIGISPGREAALIYAGKWGTVYESPPAEPPLVAVSEDVRQQEVIDSDLEKFRRIAWPVSRA